MLYRSKACHVFLSHLIIVIIFAFLQIQFGPSEFITRVYGTIGSYNTPSDVVTSITLVTNAGCYGPFGQENGIPFDFPVQGNGSIVGFFGHANLYVDAIGVYVTPSMGTRKEEENVLIYQQFVCALYCVELSYILHYFPLLFSFLS